MSYQALDYPDLAEAGVHNNNMPDGAPAEFVDIEGTRFVCIHDMDALPTFFLTMVSSTDHWLFAATNGALSAGRGSPDTALFPYYTVDKLIDNWNCTGPQTYIQAEKSRWEPFKPESKRSFSIEQCIFKSINGDVVIFEETNHSLGLRFRYAWKSSDKYGFIRSVKLTNLSREVQQLTVVDGIRDFMAAGVDSRTQQEYSCLTDAYKLSERDQPHHLLVHRMAASLTDEAVPMESLRATTVWSYGWPESQILMNSTDIDTFLLGKAIKDDDNQRAVRGQFYNAGILKLQAGESKEWAQIAEINQSQTQVAALQNALKTPEKLWSDVQADIEAGKTLLARLIAASDGQQISAEEIVTTHHSANVLFNIMRGGVFPQNYEVDTQAVRSHILKHHKNATTQEHAWLDSLPDRMTYPQLVEHAQTNGSEDLLRICSEYLPLTFSRRHGDPSRPWNRFNIQTKDKHGNAIVGFQGNWRDIFQNWEALAWSYPLYNEAFIHKFLNASTADGYNPYRITADGIDWEEPDPTDPWASIGYWGDHQIIYLLKLLEFSEKLDVDSLRRQLRAQDFVFTEVPYEIKDFAQLERDPSHSIHFNVARNTAILKRAKEIGADGKLLHNGDTIVTANMLEKLLVPALVKLSNYMPEGGIWMNTQRPEWNDANNALAGNGLSMVTTCYLHRYLNFLDRIIDSDVSDFECSKALKAFIEGISQTFACAPCDSFSSPASRYEMLQKLGNAGEHYRHSVYSNDLSARTSLSAAEVKTLIASSRAHLRATIEANKRSDGLYHAYNILDIQPDQQTASVKHLGPMLEGQVAVLSSEAIDETEAFKIMEALPKSELYCPRRKSYILYPDKVLPSFLNYNRVTPEDANAIPLLAKMLAEGDSSLVMQSSDGCIRFQADIRNRFELQEALKDLSSISELSDLVHTDELAILALYEKTFNHQSFTGRSGSMFAYEGLGSIYWHMVSKLMLAAQEWALHASDADSFKRFRTHYYDIQNGLGFRKTPKEYGAFPADAYSHTPAHAGAQQPGLTGMVKEGIICRFAELGIELDHQTLRFNPRLLRKDEFLKEATDCSVYLSDQRSKRFTLPKHSVLFTFAQTPIVYQMCDASQPKIHVQLTDGETIELNSDTLSPELTAAVLNRSQKIESISVNLPESIFLN
jgi:hypothetical protein